MSDWNQIRDGALAAEQAGVAGVWLNDHLAGSVQGASRVLECWTTLTAIAAIVPRITVGSGMTGPTGPLLGDLIGIARDAHGQSGRDPGDFVVTASTGPSARDHEWLAALGVTRAIVYLRPPYLDAVARVGAASQE